MKQTTLNQCIQEIEQLNLDEKLSLSHHLLAEIEQANLLEKIAKNKDQILTISEKHGAEQIYLIRSTPIEFLVKLQENRSLLDLGGLLMELRTLLNYELNIISEGSLTPESKRNLLKEAILL